MTNNDTWALRIGTLAALSIAVSAAIAQPTPLDVDEEVIVTGSRIPRAGFETLQPATVIDNEQIVLRGAFHLADIINEQPGFVPPGIAPSGNQGGFTVGQNVPNFLGLGEQRTLTLVNGQRLPPANSLTALAVDLNMIPDALVDRVETIAIGGAPVYGSDAIAGTVNVILKDDFDGIDFFASTGFAEEFSDANKHRFGATWGQGFGDGRGNIAIGLQHMASDGVLNTARPSTSTVTGFERPADPNSPYDFTLYEDLVIASTTLHGHPLFFGNRFAFNILGNGIPFDITDPNSALAQFGSNGEWLRFVVGEPTGSLIWKVGGDGLRLTDTRQLYSDTKRTSLTVFADYELGDSVSLHTEAWLVSADSRNIVSQPVYNAPGFGGLPANNYGNVGSGPIPVLIDNPFLGDTARNAITAALNVRHDFNNDGIADPTIDTDGDGMADAVGFWRAGGLNGVVGDDPFGLEQDTHRLVVAIDGAREMLSRDFTWDAAYTYGKNRNDGYTRTIHQPNFDQAVQVVVDVNGNPACADPANGCVPLDVIGVPSRAAIDFVAPIVGDRTDITQHVLSMNIEGDVFELPAGNMQFAAGLSYRKEELEYTPNEIVAAGLGRFELDSAGGSFNTREIYVEAVIPLLGGNLNTPGVEDFEFEGAFRYVDHSVAGSDTTWTAGLRYRPVRDLEVRGNITEAIRAPSVIELFLPATQIASFASDPCDARFIDLGDTPERRAANCAADGITQPFTSFVVNASQRGTTSGNPDLSNEVADSTTFGIIFRPRWLDAFTVSIDWFDIDIADGISSLSLNALMQACYDSASFPDEAACGRFQRDAAGQITDFQAGNVNVSSIEYKGRQTVLNYFTDLGRFGDLNLNLTHMYTDQSLFTASANNTSDVTGQIGRAAHRVNLNTTWHISKWTWYNQIRWIDDSKFNNTDEEFTRDIREAGDWTVVDSTLGYRLNDRFDLRLTVENLLDREPPRLALAFGNVGVRTYFPSIIGRFATLSMTGSF